ncbi:MAG: M20 family metallopeptidase [Bacteroidia bacterium]|jgi:amidohydrolase|nr:M20 family metallopeptidase [Bacteroidia bacterium]
MNRHELKQAVQQASKELLPVLTQIRRHLHANPELSFQEHRTAAYVEAQLDALGIAYTRLSGTGVVALIEGASPASKTIALRGDMDALPIQEANTAEYVSTVPGVMHACGHDVHTTCLLGAAHILHKLRNEFSGTVKLIFQPGEEVLPGGASLMIRDGVLESPKPEAIFAQHVFPSLPAGKVGFRSGMYMASTDELYMTVTGKGGHAAMPADYVNPLLIASAVLLKLQEQFMTAHTRLPQTHESPTVLAFGKIDGKGATNVIPSEVKLEGTFRTMNESWRKEAHALMKRIASETAQQFGGTCELDIKHGYPFLVNDEALTSRARLAAEDYLGKENVTELSLRMTAEDFAFFSQQIPACFYRLGTASPDGRFTHGVHHPNFDIDETALETGAGLLSWLVLDELK